MNFWTRLPRPFFALAPMEDVTDTVFRELVESVSDPGKLHVVFTEFMSVDGFLHDAGHEKVRHRLYVSRQERALLNEKGIRLVVQIWGSDPEKFYQTARRLTEEYDFDGIDINMGCPVHKIIRKNACSALIKAPVLAKEIVHATREGSGLPVSVKTRIGFHTVETETWIAHLLETGPAAITVHGRTQKMQSEGVADWSQVQKAVNLRDSMHPETLIVGNGDVSCYGEGLERAATSGADGIMVGRGIFGDPAFFSRNGSLSPGQRITLLKRHIDRFTQEWDGLKNFAVLKRFFKIYVNSFENATAVRNDLMGTGNRGEWMKILGDLEVSMDNRPIHRIFMPHSNPSEHEKAFDSIDHPDPLRPGADPCPD